MKLSQLIIKNFRNFVQETVIDVNDLNVLIGKNDIGKSTILEAIEIFFNSKPEKSDLSVNHSEGQIEISCVFDELPEELILDDSVPTTLQNEFLLNNDNKLQIKKKFPVSARGTISEEAFILCEYPDAEDLSDLLSKKRTTLKLQFDELGIESEGVNRNRNKDLRNAIRNHFLNGGAQTRTKEIKIDGGLDNEDNRKKIWNSLRKYLPVYSLFFVDKQLDDQDADIQDPMKEVTKEVLKRDDITPLLEQLKEAVQNASTEMADDTINKLNELDSQLAETLRSNFPKEPNWNSIFKISLEDDRGVPLNKRGSGMRRLVLLSFFRAQLENRRTSTAPNIIYALEEPETSQHPDYQLMIVNALKELSETDNAQVLFTTHNSNLAKEIPKQGLKYVFTDGETLKVENGTNPDGTDNVYIIDKIVETLGALPDPKNKVKVLVFVEGENDINALIRYSKLLSTEDEKIIDLENDERIAFIPTGGTQLKYYVEKKYLDGLPQAQVHIYDSDDQSYIDTIAGLNAEGLDEKLGFNTSKLELENYLHHNAIIECYNDLGIEINIPEISDKEDVPEKVAQAVHSATSETEWDSINSDPVKTEEKQKKKLSNAKRQLNTKAVENMTIERLKERNGLEDIKTWLGKVKELAS